jgi:hypothetical protein
MNKKTLLIFISCASAIALVVGAVVLGVWRYNKYRHAPPPPQGILLRDRSDSIIGSCGDFAAMGNEMLASGQFGKGSSIAVMITGDDSTAGEPVLLDTYTVPSTQRVTEGRSKVMQEQQDLLEKIKHRCEQAGQTKQSPIFLAVRRAVEYLQAHGCDSRSDCTLYVQSDLEELSEKKIKELLNGSIPSTRKASAASQQLPNPIDNAGISIKICGLSETKGVVTTENRGQRILTPKHDAQRADRIHSVWQKLFTDPQHVTFNPLCPKG